MARIGRISDFKKGAGDGDELFVGGGGRQGGSGQNVLDPGDGGARRDDMMGQIISAARRGGRLGGGAPAGEGSREITLWSNGFQVDGGDFRPADSPENARFLRELRRGVCPSELQASDPSAPVDVKVTDRSHEAWKEPAFTAFKGSGNTLGGGSGSAAGAVVSGASAAASDAPGPARLVVDESSPTADVQIRLANRKRLVVRCNMAHTVGDLKRHIAAETGASSAFALLGGFPPRPLADDAQTVEAAKLDGESLTQRL
jgi:UBX domain-containing protein 1